jgi:hypothetical protein
MLEYVTFHPAQLLPLFVLHITNATGSDADYLSPFVRSPGLTGDLLRGEVSSEGQRRILLTAHARKRLPSGFGPKGTHFVVEDMAPVDEDEELWGEFQTEHVGEFQKARSKT